MLVWSRCGPTDPVLEGACMARTSKPPPHETVEHWKREAKRYRPVGDAVLALGGTAALIYLSALGCTEYVRINGVSHSETGSRMGVGNPQAAALVRAEERHLLARAKMLAS